jgi:hypothetical protein
MMIILDGSMVSGHWSNVGDMRSVRRFPEMGVPPNHPFLDGFSMTKTIYFGVPP